MWRKRLSKVAAAAMAVMGAAGAPVLANSIDDAGSELVVPVVAHGTGLGTGVVVRNHETHDLEVLPYYVGERSTAAPGVRTCRLLPVKASTVLALDWRTLCNLAGVDAYGMLVLVARDPVGVGKISARAHVDVSVNAIGSPIFSTQRQSVSLDGIPLGYLDTTDNVHVVTGLRSDPGGTFPVTTDCFFATFFAGKGSGGVLGRLSLKDADGKPLGRDVYFSLKPFELLRFGDVFAKVGAPAAVYEGARAEFSLTGGGDAVMGYCRGESVGPHGSTFAFQVAQVADPREETRRRSMVATATPGVQLPGVTFLIDPATVRIRHGLYVRHPDVVKCTLRSTDAFIFTASSPDGAKHFSVADNQTGEFAIDQNHYRGPSDLWSLEVFWSPNAARTQPVSYSISCLSGNGTSLADQLDVP